MLQFTIEKENNRSFSILDTKLLDWKIVLLSLALEGIFNETFITLSDKS